MRHSGLITKGRYKAFIIILIGILMMLVVLSFSIGRFSKIDVVNIPKILINRLFPLFDVTWTKVDESVALNLRFPRIISAMVVGASLAVSGAS